MISQWYRTNACDDPVTVYCEISCCASYRDIVVTQMYVKCILLTESRHTQNTFHIHLRYNDVSIRRAARHFTINCNGIQFAERFHMYSKVAINGWDLKFLLFPVALDTHLRVVRTVGGPIVCGSFGNIFGTFTVSVFCFAQLVTRWTQSISDGLATTRSTFPRISRFRSSSWSAKFWRIAPQTTQQVGVI